MNRKQVLSMLGLAQKAGKVKSGEFATEKAVKTGSAYLILVSETASDNTKKKFGNMCLYYEVPVYYFGTKEELGDAIGKDFRATLAVIDENFAKAIETKMGIPVGKNDKRR